MTVYQMMVFPLLASVAVVGVLLLLDWWFEL